MRIDTSGNVAIGTTTPVSKLHVNNSTSIATYVTAGNPVGGTVIGVTAAGASNIATYASNVLTFGNYNSGGAASEFMRITAAGGLAIGTTADPGAGAIFATGNITAYYSDDRLKTRLGSIDDALGIIDKIDAFYYEANETAKELGYEAVREVGVSAQSVQRVLPEVVAPAPIDAEYLTVRYERLVPVLIQAIKELTARVAQLEGN
jgi:hypothetical protein